MTAFAEPSSEYILVYIQVAIVMLILMHAFWYYCLKKEETGLKVNFDDIGHETKIVEDSDDGKD